MDLKLSSALEDLISGILLTIPNIVFAFVIFFVGLMVSKLISKVIKKALSKIGVDKLGEKLESIDIVEKSNVKIKLSTIFSKAIFYILMLFIAIISTDILGLQVVSNLVNDIFIFMPNLLVAMIILIGGTIIADLLKKVVETALKSLNIPSSKMIANFLFYFLFINVLVSALTQSGIETDFLSQNITLIIGGVVLAFSISYGLAAKTSVANYLATFYIKDKFEMGDTISFKDIKGQIIDIDKASLTLRTESGKVIIPLNTLTEENVVILS